MSRPNVIHEPPYQPGMMRSGFFAWPTRKVKCPGYVVRGKLVECGVIFETDGSSGRCQQCRPHYKKEWWRLYRLKRKGV